MKFSVATLLATFTDEKLVAPKVLEKKLGCEDEVGLRQLQIALDALEKIGILVKERGKYRKAQETGYVEGRLRCSSKGFCFAIQDVEGAEDIYIPGTHLNNAWNGDRVLVAVTKEAHRRRSPEGDVRLILERANTSVLARVRQEAEQFQAVPLDDRLLFQLDLNDQEDLSDAIDYLVNVEVLRYPLGKHAPLGQVTKVLGSDAETASDVDIVRCKHSLPGAFPEAIVAGCRALPTKLRKADLKQRLDLRDRQTLAIQAIASKQSAHGVVDNAITLERTPEGGWQLGVHVVDVSAYVPADSALDQEARRRGTAVYLGDCVIPLLPEELTQGLGSLATGDDRFALSLLAEISPAGELVQFELQPSVIRLDYSLSYSEAQAILDREGGEKALKAWSGVFELVDQVAALGLVLNKVRSQQGAFALSLPDRWVSSGTDPESPGLHSRWAFNDEGSQLALTATQDQPMRALVLEIMVLANRCVGQHLQALGVPALYRIQPAPKTGPVIDLIKLVSQLGIDLAMVDDEVSAQQYQTFAQQFADSKAERVLMKLLLQPLKLPTYSTVAGDHFGLALESPYTQWVCPSHRYGDLLVQRILKTVFEEGRDRRTTRSKERVSLHSSECHGQINWNVLPPEVQQDIEVQIQTSIVQLGERESRAQEAERDLLGLKKAEYMKAHTGGQFPGLITRVDKYGFFVEIEDSCTEGLVHVSSLKDDWYEYRQRQQRLVGRKNRKQYRLGDNVEVQVKSVDYYRQQIDLLVMSGGSEGSFDDLDEDEPEFEPSQAWDGEEEE